MKNMWKVRKSWILLLIAFFFPMLAVSEGNYQRYAVHVWADCHGFRCLLGEKWTFYVGPRDPVDERISYKAEKVDKQGGAGIYGVGWRNSSDPSDAKVQGTIWANAFGHITCRIDIYYRGAWQDGVPKCDPFVNEVFVRPTLFARPTPIYVEFMLKGISGSTLPVKIGYINIAGCPVGKSTTVGLGYHVVKIPTSDFIGGKSFITILIRPDGLDRWVYGVGNIDNYGKIKLLIL